MSEIVVACLITWAGWGLAPNQAWFQAKSLASCQDKASNLHYGIVGTTKIFDLTKPEDARQFEIYCGKGGKDCRS